MRPMDTYYAKGIRWWRQMSTFFITKMQSPSIGTCEYKCSAERRELDTLQLVQIEVSDCEGDRLMMPHCRGQT